jgi:hypothetical protein
MRALAADPSQRYPTAIEFRRALHAYHHRSIRRIPIALGSVLFVVVVAVGLWPRGTPTPSPVIVVPTLQPVAGALSADLTVRVWTPANQQQRGKTPKRGWSVEDPQTLPVRLGEQVQVKARLNQPAYPYILWLDGQGRVASLYPWKSHHFEQPRGDEHKRDTIQSPGALDEGWPMQGPAGLETVLLLARRTPLPEDVDLPLLIGQMPPAPLRNPKEVIHFNPNQPEAISHPGVKRGVGAQPQRIDDALLELIKRLNPHFELVQFTRFAYQGE